MISFSNAFQKFNKQERDDFEKLYITFEDLRLDFVKIFPKSHLDLMEIDDYVIGKTKELNNESFCYWLETKLRSLGSIKGGSAEKFGVFYSQTKKQYVTLKRWSNSFDCNDAFVSIKKEICSLLSAGESKNFALIDDCKLPEMLKNKILSTYYPNDYISVFAIDHVDFFCYELGIDITNVTSPSQKRNKLLEYKNSDSELSKLNNYIFMRLLYFWYRPYMRSIRILPMSSKFEFPNMNIPDIQNSFFHGELTEKNGKFQYRSKGINVWDYTYVLFQFKNSIIASARLLKKEKYEEKQGDYEGYYVFDVSTIKTFEPITSDELKELDISFNGFSQATTSLDTRRQARLIDLIISKQDSPLPEEISKPANINEGAKKQITVNAYERSGKARQLCLESHGYKCAICNFDFGKIYGEQFEGKIHVHHKTPLNEIDNEYTIDPLNDLVPVCPNCHLVIHSKSDGCYAINEVIAFLKNNNNKG